MAGAVEAGGLEGLADRSHRPERCRHQTIPEVEARVLELRRVHPSCGARRIVLELGRGGAGAVAPAHAVSQMRAFPAGSAATTNDIISFMARRGRSGSSADPGLAESDGVRRGGRARVPGGGWTVFGFGLVCLVLGAMVARLVVLMVEAHSEFGGTWLPAIAEGCVVSVGWAGLYFGAIGRFPSRRWVQWIGYAYAFATIVLTVPFFPRIPGMGWAFTSRLHPGSSPPLLDWLELSAMAFAAAGITIAVLAILFNRPLSRFESRRLPTRAAASSVLSVPARLREIGPAGPGSWRRGELRLAPGSVTWSISRGGARVDLTGARLLTAGYQAGARVSRARTVLVLTAAGRFEVGVRPELFKEFTTLADHFRPWRDQNAEAVDREPE